MSIVYEPEQMLFHLSTEHTSYLSGCSTTATCTHQYWVAESARRI